MEPDRRRFRSAPIVTMFTVLLIAGVVVLQAATYKLPSKPSPVPLPTPTVSEEPIDPATYTSKATGGQPKYLRLPSIGAEGFVEGVGVDAKNRIDVPSNIHLAGWFNQMAAPGEPGLSIIDGHLDGTKGPGIFRSLAKLKPGDQFSVELANGKVRAFKVATVATLSTAEAAGALFSQDPLTSSQLNLITCAGNYTSLGYDKRVLVTAALTK